MAGTYTRIYIHCVFAVRARENLLQKPWRDEVFSFMAGIIYSKNQKPFIVNGVEDHVHILLGYTPTTILPDLIRDIKNNSSKYINERGFLETTFAWQRGYGAFSCGHSQLDRIYQYILNQEEHHLRKTFRNEYLRLLKRYDVNYDSRYVFDRED